MLAFSPTIWESHLTHPQKGFDLEPLAEDKDLFFGQVRRRLLQGGSQCEGGGCQNDVVGSRDGLLQGTGAFNGFGNTHAWKVVAVLPCLSDYFAEFRLVNPEERLDTLSGQVDRTCSTPGTATDDRYAHHTNLPSFIDPCLARVPTLPGTHVSGCCALAHSNVL